MSISEMNALASKAKMITIHLTALELLEAHFYENQTKNISKRTKLIMRVWERSVSEVGNLFSLACRYYIYMLLQDYKPNWSRYFKELVVYYSIPSIGERKRIFVFSKDSIFLNAITKIFSAILYRLKILK
jgi:hypothetical protein